MESSDKKYQYQTYDSSLDFNQTKHCFTDNLIVKCLCIILKNIIDAIITSQLVVKRLTTDFCYLFIFSKSIKIGTKA